MHETDETRPSAGSLASEVVPFAGRSKLPAKRSAARPGELQPLADDLEPEVRAFVERLREIFGMTQMSLGQFAHLRYRDKGAVSKYLSGKRMPPRDFVDDLLEELAHEHGAPATPELRDLVRELHLRALQVRDAQSYRLQVLTDQLEIATTDLRQSRSYADYLQGQLTDRQEEVQTLSSNLRRTSDAFNAERDRSEAARRAFQEKIAADVAEKEWLKEEIEGLRASLSRTEDLQAEALARCAELEAMLDQIQDLRTEEPREEASFDVAGRSIESLLAAERLRQGLELFKLDTYDRIQAIIDLAQLARASAEHHTQVMNALVDFVREHCSDSDQGGDSVSGHGPRLPLGVEEALRTIGRRNTTFDTERIDLSNVSLEGVNLVGGDFSGVNFSGTNLSRATLASAIFYRTVLADADLSGANLHGANLTEAGLAGANLAAARMYDATLFRADLSAANLTNAILSGADLREAHISGQALAEARLDGARIDDNTELPSGWEAEGNGDFRFVRPTPRRPSSTADTPS